MNEKCKKWEQEIVESIAEKATEAWMGACSVQCSWDILVALDNIEHEITVVKNAHAQALDEGIELLKRAIIDYLEPSGVGRSWYRKADIVRHIALANDVEPSIVRTALTGLECDGQVERDLLDIPDNWIGECIYRLKGSEKRVLMAVTED